MSRRKSLSSRGRNRSMKDYFPVAASTRNRPTRSSSSLSCSSSLGKKKNNTSQQNNNKQKKRTTTTTRTLSQRRLSSDFFSTKQQQKPKEQQQPTLRTSPRRSNQKRTYSKVSHSASTSETISSKNNKNNDQPSLLQTPPSQRKRRKRQQQQPKPQLNTPLETSIVVHDSSDEENDDARPLTRLWSAKTNTPVRPIFPKYEARRLYSPPHVSSTNSEASDSDTQQHLCFAPKPARYTYDQFCDNWDSICQDDMHTTTEEIEQSRCVRSANSIMAKSDSQTQGKAQYGRLIFGATDHLFVDVLQLDPATDLFLDIGHGIGNAVLQAAYVHNVHSRGIEVVSDRNAVAVAFQAKLRDLKRIHLERDNINYQVASVELVCGSLQDVQHRNFIIQPPPHLQFIKAFCNNYNGVFKDSSAKGKDKMIYLDNYNAGLFAMMPPGSVLATLDLLNLPPARSVVHEHQRRAGVTGSLSANASFYEVEKIELCEAKEAVSWTSGCNDKMMYVYKYTRLQQDSEDAVFECWNRSCPNFCRPVNALQNIVNPYSHQNGIIARTSCHCNVTDRGLRSRTRNNYK